MRYSLFLILLIITNSIAAQVNVDYILEENFEDNKNSWKLNNGKDFVSEIKDNSLYFNNKTKNFKKAFLKTKLDLKKNFKIETTIKLISGTDNNELSIIFNKDEKNKNYNTFEEFGFTDNGFWRYDKNISHENIEETGWLEISNIKSKEYNKLTILKIDTRIFFLINDKPVLVKNNLDFFYKGMAINICNNAEVAVDYLKFGYLKASKKEKENFSKKLYQQIVDAKANNENVILEDTTSKELETSFDDNKAFDFFLGETENYNFKILEGALELENKSKDYYQTWAQVKINKKQNFDLSASIKRISGAKNKGISLIIKNKERILQFAYAQSGHWFSNLIRDNKSYNFSKWQKTSLIKGAENNSLRIKKIGNAIYFILNDKVLNKVKNQSTGNTIYIKIPDSIKVRVDDLKLTQSFDSHKKQQKLIAEYDKLWNDAKLENVGAFGKTKEQQIAYDKAEKKFKKKEDKDLKKYNKIFKDAPYSEVIKKMGQPYLSSKYTALYRYNDSFDGRPQSVRFALIPHTKGNIKYLRVSYVMISYAD